MKKLYHFIINEHAGSGKAKKIADTILAYAKEKIDYKVHYSNYPGHVYELVMDLKADLKPYDSMKEEEVFPLLVVIGGDGTLHEVMNSLYPHDLNIPVAYIPAGSGNDFSRGIGFTRNPIKAFEQIIAAKAPQEVNLITYEEGISGREGVLVNNLGIGLDASIVHAANDSKSKATLNHVHLGGFSYIVAILKQLFAQKSFPVRLEVNGDEYNFKKDYLFSITNHPYFGGGVPIAPGANPFEKNFDVVILEKIAFFKIAYLIILLVQKKHLKSKNITHLKSNRLHLTSTVPQYAQLDGEVWEKQSYDFQFSLTSGYIWF